MEVRSLTHYCDVCGKKMEWHTFSQYGFKKEAVICPDARDRNHERVSALNELYEKTGMSVFEEEADKIRTDSRDISTPHEKTRMAIFGKEIEKLRKSLHEKYSKDGPNLEGGGY
ncbi:hypothetical protein HZC30_02840 [Candidatus Woesearchaeota archaeon]|nr:hypothetical protein [Candidatus Woesearchaeota archaeon]